MTYRYNVVVDISIDNSGVKQGQAGVSASLSAVEQEAKQASQRIVEANNLARNSFNNLTDTFETDARRMGTASQEMAQKFRTNTIEIEKMNSALAQTQALNRQILNRDPFQFANNQSLRSSAQSVINTTNGDVGRLNNLILQRDPFQFANNIPGGIQGQVLGLNAQIRQLDPFQNQKLVPLNQTLQQITRNANQAGNALGYFGSAFAGAFTGALTGTTFRLLLEIPQQMIEVTRTSIEAAANYERLSNSFVMFTGSAEGAKTELAEIEALSRNTPGLGLETAEEGAKRLRAMGFEAQETRDLLQGLAKIQLISGASQQSLDRFIYNLTQIRSAGKLTGAELRDALRELPAFGPVLKAAFGTTRAEDIRALNLTSDEFFKKLIDALKNVKSVAGDSLDAYQKFNDSILRAERQFGAGFLGPGTERLKEFTAYLDDNGDAWERWGKIVSTNLDGAITGLYQAGLGIKTLYEIVNQLNPITVVAQVVTKAAGPTAGQVVANSAWQAATDIFLGIPAGLFRIGQARQEYDKIFGQVEMPDARKAMKEIGVNPATIFYEKETQANAEAAKKEEKINNDRISNFSKDQQAIKELRDTALNNTQSYYDLQLAIINKGLTNTTQEELAKEQDRFDLLKRFHQSNQLIRDTQLDVLGNKLQDYLDNVPEDKRDSTAASEPFKKAQADYYKMESENSKQRAKDIAQEIEAKNKLLQIEMRLIDERREALVQQRQLQSSELQNIYSSLGNTIQKTLDSQVGNIQNGYNNLIDLTNQSANKMAEITNQSYNLQLTNQKLSLDEKRNLEYQNAIEIEKIYADNSEKLADIQEKSYQQSIARTKEYVQAITQSLSESANILKTGVSQFLQPDFSFGQGFQGGGQGSPAEAFLSLFGDKSLGQLLDNIEKVKQGTMSFYELQKQQLDLIHKKEVEAIDLQIRTNNLLIDNAKREFEGGLRRDKIGFEGQIQILQARRDRLRTAGDEAGASTAQAGINVYQSQLDKTNADLQAIEKGANITTDVIKKLKNENIALENQKIAESFAYNAQTLEAFRKETEGLIGDYKKLTAGEYDFIIKHNAENDTWNQKINLVTQLKTLELGYYKDTNLLILQRGVALKEAQKEIELRDFNAVIASDKARLELGQKLIFSQTQADADFLEFLAAQKGITEIMSDARINLLTDAYDGLDKVFQSLTKNLGFASDAAAQFLSSLTKLFLNQAFQWLTGVNLNGQGSAGIPGFSVPGASNRSQGVNPIQSIGNLLNSGVIGGNQISAPLIYSGNNLYTPNLSAGSNQNGIINMLGQGEFIGPDLLPAGTKNTGLTSGLLSGLQGLGGSLPFLGPLIGASLGSGLGGPSTTGRILGGLGGAAAGLAAVGLLAPGALVGALGITGALAATGIGLVAAPALLLASYFIGRSSQRKSDEKIHNQAMLDALSGLDSLIGRVRVGYDGPSALAEAQQIRQKYVDTVSAIKDKKTRNIAMSASELGRIDAKIADLNGAVNQQLAQKARQNLLVPTFADGGTVSNWMFKNNPLGYQSGMGTSRSDSMLGYFPSANQYARFSNSEYIFDAETTRNMGIPTLDMIRSNKGRNFQVIPTLDSGNASGGSLANPSVSVNQSTNNGNSGKLTLEVVVTDNSQLSEVVSAKIMEHAGSGDLVDAINTYVKKTGDTGLLRTVDEYIKKKNK